MRGRRRVRRRLEREYREVERKIKFQNFKTGGGEGWSSSRVVPTHTPPILQRRKLRPQGPEVVCFHPVPNQ